MECDSSFVVQALKNLSIVPWRLRNKRNRCVHITRSMSFLVGHIYREGNTYADRLAAHDTIIQDFFFVRFYPSSFTMIIIGIDIIFLPIDFVHDV